MDERMLKEGMAKVVAYVFQAFLSGDEVGDRLIQMKNNIIPAMRKLINYAGVKDPEEMEKLPFVTPYDVLEDGLEKVVKAFYDELRKKFSTESRDENYAAMQKRVIAWLDRSEARMLEAVKKQLKTDIATQQEVTKIFLHLSELLENETARLNKYLAEENRQYAKSVVVSNCIKKGYQAYRFVTEGENCEDCNSLNGKTFPLSEAKIGENMAPMHPNCNCRTGVLDKNGNIAFYAEDLRDGKVPERTRPRTLPAIQPWTLPQTQKEEAKKGDGITELSESEALFIAKLQSIGVSFDKALEILSEMKRTNGKVPEEKYKEWGFADKAGIAYVELQYKMIREGMTLEQYDYLESNASLSAATSIAITQLARAAMQKVRQRAVEKQINAAKNEGNNESTNKGNTAKPNAQQGTAEGVGEKLKISDSQFGKKVGKHAEDFGLDPSNQASRDFVKNRVNEIFEKPTEIRKGFFRGQGEILPSGANASGVVKFYIQGADVVIIDMNNNFITIMKDGINNPSVIRATKIWP